jgi:hypothetical protein
MGRYAQGGAFRTLSVFALVVGLVMMAVFVVRSALHAVESNTPAGNGVVVGLEGGVTVTFGVVSGAGSTGKLAFPARGTAMFDHFYPLKCMDLSTTAAYSGGVTIRLSYRLPYRFSEDGVRLLYSARGAGWHDVTTSLDRHHDRVSGHVRSLSRFASVYLQYPGLTAVTPRSVARGGTVSVHVSGFGFWSTSTSDPTVRLDRGSDSISGTNVVVRGPDRISCDFTIPVDAGTGPWRVIVTSPDGYDTIDRRHLMIVR